MNSHKKLRELGFKKTIFYKPGYNSETYQSCMMPDDIISSIEIIDGNIKIIYMSPEYLVKGDGLELAKSLIVILFS